MGIGTGDGLKVLDTSNRCRLRFLNWGNAGTNQTLYITNVYMSRYDNKTSAEIKTEASVRASADSAQASSINSLASTVNGHTASITTLQQVDQGLTAKWTLTLNANNHISGIQVANGGAGQSSMVFLTDRFAVAQPSGAGVTFPFTIGSVGGISTVGINGNLVVDGTITSRTVQDNSLGPAKLSNAVITAGFAAGNTSAFTANGAFVSAMSYTFSGPNTGSGLVWIEVEWGAALVHNTNVNPAGSRLVLFRNGVEFDSYSLDSQEQQNWLGRIIAISSRFYGYTAGQGANTAFNETFQVGFVAPNGTGTYTVSEPRVRARAFKLN
jgi:hypothetical protein